MLRCLQLKKEKKIEKDTLDSPHSDPTHCQLLFPPYSQPYFSKHLSVLPLLITSHSALTSVQFGFIPVILPT